MVRLLVVSDIHGSMEAVKSLIEDVEKRKLKVDLIVLAGDIGSPQNEERLRIILEELSTLGVKGLYIRGNWDIGSKEYDSRDMINLDNNGPFEIDDIVIVGHGEKYRPYSIREKKVILVTHYPPYGILDRGFKYTPYKRGSHTGLMVINKLIEEYNPIVHVFGHAHKCGGLTLYLNNTYYVNVARLDRFTKEKICIGNYTYIRLEDKVIVSHYYINGRKKVCSRCKREVLMPPSWNVCKECMMKDELYTESLASENIKDFSIRIHYPDGIIKLSEKPSIVLKTIRSNTILREYIEDYIKETIYNLLKKRHKYVIFVPKDGIPSFVPCPLMERQVEPFVVQLFRCRKCKGITGSPVCSFYKTLLKYKLELVWAFDERRRGEGYIIVFRKSNSKLDEKVIVDFNKIGYNTIEVILPPL